MTRSTDRIRTTHAGALSRPDTASKALTMLADDPTADASALTTAVADVVDAQVDVGVDIVNDGEFGKSIWQWYVTERLTGLERREWREPLFRGRDRERFPEFYAYADATPGVLFQAADEAFAGSIQTQPVCVGPIGYDDTAVQRDIANLKAAVAGREDITDVFMPVAAPISIQVAMANEHYAGDEEFMWAIADAIKHEYRAIVDAGFQLQVDDAWIPALWDREPDLDERGYRALCQGAIDALHHALDGIPEEKVRYHLCWGSWHGPHATDVPLADIVDLMLHVRAGTYLFEAANPRHEHEYRIWEEVTLPDGKVLAPGVVTHSTNTVEHPELVALRIRRFADLVGRENVIAGTDCGMGSRIHPELGWAKLRALGDGAQLASAELWQR